MQRANVTPAGGASPTVRISILECYCACRRHQRCHLKERRLRYVPALYGQLSDKLLLACIQLCGVWVVKSNGGSKKYALIQVDDGGCTQKVFITLAEKGTAYDTQNVDLFKNEQFEKPGVRRSIPRRRAGARS